MSEQKGFWNNAIFTTVVSGTILSALTALAHFAGITVSSAFEWLKRVVAFWSANVTLSRWAFWSWVIVTALAAAFITLQIYFNLQEPDAPARAAKKPVSFSDYRTDIFRGGVANSDSRISGAAGA